MGYRFLYGGSGGIYELAPEPLNSGAESDIYGVVGRDDLVCKIFKGNAEEKHEKVLAMLDRNIRPTRDENGRGGTSAWPLEALYSGNGYNKSFVGYLMYKFSGIKYNILVAYSPGDRLEFTANTYNYKFNLMLAFNLASVTQWLHERGICVTDWNTKNFLVTKKFAVIGVDTDGWTIPSKTGKVFKARCGRPEFYAPELQGIRPSSDAFKPTVESDRFSLAVHIFMILNNGEHPFGIYGTDTNENIKRKACPYERNVGEIFPHSPDYCRTMPTYLRKLFARAFLSDNPKLRPSAGEWMASLKRYLGEMVECKHHPTHLYWKRAQFCPWCEMGMDERYLVLNQIKGRRPRFVPIEPDTSLVPLDNLFHPLQTRPNKPPVPRVDHIPVEKRHVNILDAMLVVVWSILIALLAIF